MEIKAPRGRIYHQKTEMGEAKVILEWKPGFEKAANRMLASGGRLQQLIDSMVLESIEPYLPFGSGMLAASGRLHTIIGSGLLVWKTPYAKYHFGGKLMVDPQTMKGAFHNPITGRFWSRRGVRKILTDRDLTYRGGGKRGAHWPQRWMADNLEQFEANMQKRAGQLWRTTRQAE